MLGTNMKKSRSRNLSAGGAMIFSLFFFAHFLAGFISLLLREGFLNWSSYIYLSCIGILSVFIWFGSLRPLISSKLWRIPKSWYEASFALATLYFIYALIVFVTGFTPTKYGSHPIPREAGFIWLIRAGTFSLVGLIAYIYEKCKRYNRAP